MVVLGVGCTPQATLDEPQGAILPHHLFVDYLIDDFYERLAQETTNIDQIILLSPNHLGYGHTNIQTTDYDSREHGITVHLPYIETYFPGAEISPATFKFGTSEQELNAFIDELLAQNFRHTLVLASIDFTHLEPEEIALQNDQRTIEWLGSLASPTTDATLSHIHNLAATTGENSLEGAVALDSPETLYVFAQLMRAQEATQFKLWQRTSTASLGNLQKPEDMTSHIFGTFTRPDETPN